MSKFYLKGVRGSFIQLAEPAKEGKCKGKYSLQVSFQKNSENTKAFVEAMNIALKEAVEKYPFFKRFLKSGYKPGLTIGNSKFLQDGDTKFDSKGESIEMLQGCYFFTPTNTKPVPVYNPQRKLLTSKEEIEACYPGDYYNVICNINAYNNEHGTGLGIYLQGVQATFTGENLIGNSVTNEDIENAFDMIVEEQPEALSSDNDTQDFGFDK